MNALIRPHAYEPDGVAAGWGDQSCRHCTLARGNAIHITPEPPTEAAIIDARVLGEHIEEGDA